MENIFDHSNLDEDDLERKVEVLRKAVHDPGRVPRMHNLTMRQHRQEWPTLWEAIDDLVGRAQ